MKNSYSKKLLLYLSLVWGSLIVSAAIVATLYFTNVSELIISIVIFVLFIYLFFVLLISKAKISFYDLQHRYRLLLDHSIGLENTACNFDNTWIESLLKHGYTNYLNKSDFAIYYKITKSLSKRTFIKTNVIEIICIVRNNKLDFYANEIEKEFKNLWMKFEKDNRLNKQVIIQFKKYDSYTEVIKADLDRIISYKEGDNYLVNINCGYFTENKSIYYLHSDRYYPSVYYKKAVDTIKEIINY
ncbi:MAG: hypothetical protein PHC62_08045 [Candidatus Izemoplasmatales bacterium]|nr:hypothetical protein [Candidatus Izemoplasmatales bacterium]